MRNMAACCLRTVVVTALVSATAAATVSTLNAHNVDPSSISVSGFSSGGFMAVQLGVAYSSLFKAGFGAFAGGPYDCGRDQQVSPLGLSNIFS